MRPLDLAIVAAYLVLTLGVGLWRTRGQSTATDYFLGARDLPAWAVLLSIVATETSALTVISVPGIGARGDLTFLQLAAGYLVGRIAVARWLLPGYFNGTQETAYQRLEQRFGTPTRRVMSGIFLVTRFLGDGVRVFAGAIPLAIVTGWSVPSSIVAMGAVTLLYTWFGGIRAVVWADVLQLSVYLVGGVASLVVAWRLAGGAGQSFALAGAAGKLRLTNPSPDLSVTYTLLGGLVGGAMLSAASHGTDHLIVQRLLATRGLREARVALVGSGVMVLLQFALFLLVGQAIWAAGLAPADRAADLLFPTFLSTHLPVGIAGLMVAGILAAAMGTHASAINALASSFTHDLYASWSGRTEPTHLFRVGRVVTIVWGVGLVLCALAFVQLGAASDTPVVVLALSIASVTSGALLGAYLLAGLVPAARGRDVIAGAAATVAVMLPVIFARRLATQPAFGWLAPAGRLAWPWYVVLGTLTCVGTGVVLSRMGHGPAARETPANG